MATGPSSFGSKNEENVYRALAFLQKTQGLGFAYQVPLDGGRSVRGGQVVDFIIYVPPRPVAGYVQGAYWHWRGTATEDQLKQDRATQAGYRVVLLEEHETMTYELALDTIKKKVL